MTPCPVSSHGRQASTTPSTGCPTSISSDTMGRRSSAILHDGNRSRCTLTGDMRRRSYLFYKPGLFHSNAGLGSLCVCGSLRLYGNDHLTINNGFYTLEVTQKCRPPPGGIPANPPRPGASRGGLLLYIIRVLRIMKGHLSGSKFSRQHTTVIDAAVKPLAAAESLECVSKIVLNVIQGCKTATVGIKCTTIPAGLKVVITGNHSVQTIFVYTSDLELTQQVMEAALKT